MLEEEEGLDLVGRAIVRARMTDMAVMEIAMRNIQSVRTKSVKVMGELEIVQFIVSII